MKICVTARGSTLKSPFEPHFAQAPFFIIHDMETRTSEAIRNGFIISDARIGRNAVRLLVNNGVDIVITGEIGENARALLKGFGIALHQTSTPGTVKHAITGFMKNDPGKQQAPA